MSAKWSAEEINDLYAARLIVDLRYLETDPLAINSQDYAFQFHLERDDQAFDRLLKYACHEQIISDFESAVSSSGVVQGIPIAGRMRPGIRIMEWQAAGADLEDILHEVDDRGVEAAHLLRIRQILSSRERSVGDGKAAHLPNFSM